MATTTIVDIHEAETRFAELLSLVVAGVEVILTEHQKPLARLVPERTNEPERIPGLHAGMISMSEDFDELLPDEFWVNSV